MAKTILMVVIISVILAGCRTPIPAPANKPTATQAAVSTVTSTASPEPTHTATIEPTQTLTPEPSATSTLANNPAGYVGVAKNHLGAVEEKGVEVEKFPMVVADAQKFDYEGWKNQDEFLDAKSMVELMVKITNNTDGLISFLGLDYGLVAINDEQTELSQFYWKYHIGRGGHDILPGISVEMGIWFPVYQSEWDEIEEIRISLLGAFSAKGIGFTDDFAFTVSVDDWGFEAKQP